MTARGEGTLFKKRTRDPVTGEVREGSIWYAQVYLAVLGRHRKRSTRTSDEQKARRFLAKWKAEILGGAWLPDAERTTFDDLAEMLSDDYAANGRKSARRLGSTFAHLRPAFGHLRARVITSDRITAYTRARLAEGAKPASVNRELAALRRMFRLGEIAGKVARRPHVQMLEERNARKGFFERDQFDAVMRHLPEDLRAVVHVAYLTGWRLASELLTRQRKHVDFTHGWLRLEPGETKNDEGRQFPLTAELRAVLERQRDYTRALERTEGRIIPWVFHRGGQPIKTLRRLWKTACRRAGVPGRLIHDFRRTAVRNLERAGVPRSVTMKLVGHKTEAMYRRYAIVSEADLKEQAQKLDTLASMPVSMPLSLPTL
jgi:integrase